jgi:CHAT domain-containing protein
VKGRTLLDKKVESGYRYFIQRIVIFFLFVFQAVFLYARVIRVPQEYYSIKTAVSAALDGDIVEVDDGLYFEKEIIISKKILIRAKNFFGAIIYGSGVRDKAIFVMRAEAEIEGFILKNSDKGIEQRYSPDVLWRAHDMAFLHMRYSAIAINDVQSNIGSAILENIIIAHCESGISTNDARSVDVHNAFFVNCKSALIGSNHLAFTVSHSGFLSCSEISPQKPTSIEPSEKNVITLTSDTIVLDRFLTSGRKNDLLKFIKEYLTEFRYKKNRNDNYQARREALVYALVGEVYLRTGDLIAAKKAFNRSLDGVKKTGLKDIGLIPILALAQINEKCGRKINALRYYLDAIDEIDSILEGLPVWFYKPNYFADKIDIFEGTLGLLFELHRSYPDMAYDQEAFRIAERAKNAGIMPGILEFDLLKSGERTRSGWVKSKAEIVSRISKLQIDLLQQLGSREERSLLEDLESAEDECIAFIAHILKQRREIAKIGYPITSGLTDIRSLLLAPDRALIEYFWGNKNLYAFFLSQKAFLLVRIADTSNLSLLIKNYLPFISFNRPDEFRGVEGGRKLFECLIGPFESDIKTEIKKIIIIPDGILHYLPFETLIRNGDSPHPPGKKDGNLRYRFLIEDYEISYASSASYLAMMRSTWERETHTKDILAVTGRPGARYGRQFPMRSANPADLPYADKEVKAITGLFRSDMAIKLGGKVSGETEFIALPLNKFKTIHFAAHGLFNDQNWLRSALLLGGDPKKGEDGLLQPLEIFLLNLNADLVTLSACQSGDGRMEWGGGLLGLSLPFLLAGARSVITALWSINDLSTSEFMVRFYSHLMKDESKGGALRSAKIEMLDSKYRHPYFWAPFVLSGDSISIIRFISKE